MYKLKNVVLGFILLFMGLASAQAGMLDLRVGAGLLAANPDQFEDRVNNISGHDLSSDTFDEYNADVIFHIPATPLTLGVRYEQGSQKQSDSGSDWKLNVNNLSLLVGVRLINSKFYLGPVVGIGYPWGNLDFHSGSSSEDHHLKSDQISYSGGLETGIYLGPFLIGAEAGYKSVRLKTDSSSSSNSVNTNINMEGFYGKALVGLTFF
jgi:hypothetical protein